MTAAARAEGAAPGHERWVWGLRHVVVCVLFAAFSLNTSPGQIFNDTKLDLVLAPGDFLRRALHLWDPLGSGGQLQNQAYGYLFPMGPFFALGRLAGMPEWVVQRLWWTVLLSVSYAGFVVLARRLGIGTDWTRLVAGVGFALAPHVLTLLGRSSVEVWPPALAPWVLVPLVGVGAAGRPRRAAALSGLAILCMGGVNAAVNLAAVLPAVLWLLTRRWDRALLRLVGWWVLSLVVATLWWVVPLLALGRYSPPFLDFIESATFTTSTTPLVETLRGTADWVAYLYGSGSRAGFALITNRLLILNTVLLVAAGLAGIALRRTRERRWLTLMLLVGVALVTLGHDGSVHGFLAADLRTLLDGSLAPIRNVHKFDILIRLALSFGFAAALTALSRGASQAETRFLRPVVAAAGAFVVVGTATPFLALAASPTSAFDGVPGYWQEASAWMSSHGSGRTLLVPGSRFADYQWGYAGDEPFQALSSAPWDIRNAVPLTDPAHVRWLDALERRVADGVGGSDLATDLADGGVRYLLLRSDLNFGPEGATRPAVVRSLLARTPGVRLVRTFGPSVGGGGTAYLEADQRLDVPAPAIEIYEVSAAGEPFVAAQPMSSVARAVAGAERAGQGGGGGTFVRVGSGVDSGSAAAQAGGARVLTDSPRRREVNVGVGAFGASYTLTRDDPLRIIKSARDYGASDAEGAEAVARFEDGASVTASSSAGDADTYPWSDPGTLPYAAFDRSLRSEWRPNSAAPVQKSWVQATVREPVSLAGGYVLLDVGTAVTEVTLTTDRGTTTLPVDGDRALLPDVETRLVRIGLRTVEGDRTAKARAGIRSVAVTGLDIERTVVLPRPPWTRAPDRVELTGDVGRVGCLWASDRPFCGAGVARVGEDAGGLDRTMTMRENQRMRVAVTARAVPTAALRERVASAMGLEVAATASTQSAPDLVAGPLAAVDGDLGTTWVADPGDPDPTLTLRWSGKRSVSSVQLLLDGYASGTRATRVRIESPAGDRAAAVGSDGRATFKRLRTDRLTLHLSAPSLAQSLDPYTVVQSSVGIAISDVVVPGVTPKVRVSSDAFEHALTFRCGEGPPVAVAGVTVRTKVTTTVGAVLRGEPLTATPCDGDGVVTMPAGDVRVTGGTPDAWDVSTLTLTKVGTAEAARPGASSSSVSAIPGRWDATHRTVAIGPRPSATLLRVRENANSGWRATVDGAALTPVTVDGWQQGWVVPAGSAETVTLTFTPDAPVRAGVALGWLLVLPLLGLALLRPGRVRRRYAVVPGGAWTRLVVVGFGVVCLAAAGGPWGLAAAMVAGGLPLLLRRLGRPLPPRWTPLLAATAYLLAGMVLLSGPYASGHYRADAWLTQLLCLLALACVLAALARPWPRRRAVADFEMVAAREKEASPAEQPD